MTAKEVLAEIRSKMASHAPHQWPSLPDALDALEVELAAKDARIAELEAFQRSVNEALNSGDGSYRP